jgi:hypothetical protein
MGIQAVVRKILKLGTNFSYYSKSQYPTTSPIGGWTRAI